MRIGEFFALVSGNTCFFDEPVLISCFAERDKKDILFPCLMKENGAYVIYDSFNGDGWRVVDMIHAFVSLIDGDHDMTSLVLVKGNNGQLMDIANISSNSGNLYIDCKDRRWHTNFE